MQWKFTFGLPNVTYLYDHAIYKIHKGGCIVQIHPPFVYLFFSLN